MNATVSLWEIVAVMAASGVAALGGGGGAVAVIQGHWVTGGQLEPALFAWAFALSHLVPGPRINFTPGVGYYLAGLPGALAAVVGSLVPTCVSAAAVSRGMHWLRPIIGRVAVPGAFLIAGLMVAAGWGTAASLQLQPWELVGVALVTWLVGWRNVDPVYLVLGAAALGLLWRLGGW